MKTKAIKNISQKIMTGFLAVTMIVTGVVLVPKTTQAATTQEYFATAEEYKISEYWTESEKKVPVKKDYVFSGWYMEDKTTPLKQVELTDETVANMTAIAKFVPAEVLSIKTQAALGTDTSSLRILSTVDSLNYQEVGFEYKLGTLNEAKTGDKEKITKVYSAIKPYKGATDEELLTPSNEFVSGVSKYFIAADVSSIVKGSYEKIVYARPYWVTMDGTEVMGLARNNRIVDKQNNQYTSVGINLLTDGKAPAMVAAGKIQVKYNTTDYNVVGATADTTYDATYGGKYLFPEMECHVDEAAGTITFVGNAETVDTNLLGDGLFANVRFEKDSSASSTATLDFQIKTEVTDFCNWLEAPVTKFVVQ